MSIHVCKCTHNGREEWHLRYPGLSQEDAQRLADRINGGALSNVQPKGMPTNALAGAVCSVAEARGFVAFGAGVYRIQETQEPGLVVTFRRDGEQHYGIGDLAPEVDPTPIPADDIIVRLQFTSAAGLDSLEHHLRRIRAQHWPETAQAPAPADTRAVARVTVTDAGWAQLRVFDTVVRGEYGRDGFDILAALASEINSDATPCPTPVAWRYRPGVSWPWVLSDDGYEVSCKRDKGYQVEGLAVAQAPAPAHGPLTSEAILDLAEPMRHLLKGANDWALVREFGRAVERAALAAISSPAVQDGGRTPRVESEGYQQRLAQERQDAARYRFLRDADRSDPAIDFDKLLSLAMESMDAAIDEAMGREASSFDVPVQGSQP